MTTDRVREILSWYNGNPPGVLANLYRMLNTGKLAGTGKLVILPVDQGFEHGPARTFAPNPEGYDPRYHVQLAIESGCSAHAAPLGSIEVGANEFAGQVPLILKVNNSDGLYSSENPCPAVTSGVGDALRLGCAAIGFTIYPGSAFRNDMYEQIREMIEEAKAVGLPTVIWSYPRGSGLSKKGETAIDVASYAAQIACQLGAHIVKVKLPTDHLEMSAIKKVYEEKKIPISTMAERVQDVVRGCLGGRRIVIFSGGASKDEASVLGDIQAIADGGGFGSIMGRNAFQRPKEESLALLGKVMDIYTKVS